MHTGDLARRRIDVRACASVLVVLLPAAARADRDVVIDATAQTLAAARPDARDGETRTLVPFLGAMSLRATGITAPGIEDLRIVVSAWGQIDPAEPARDDHVAGDVNLAFVEGEARKGRLQLRLGRQILFGGAGRATPFDGLFIDGRVVRGLGISAEIGLPVTPRFAVDRGDLLWGARVYYRHSIDAEIGASYLHVLDDGDVARFDLGLDARWQPAARWLTGGRAVMSAAEGRLAEAQLYAALDASPRLRIAVDATRTAPDLFLPRTSILWVFSDETRDEGGTTVTWRPSSRLRLEADARLLRVEAGAGGRASLRADWRRDEHALGAELRALRVPGDGYLNARAFGRLAASARSNATLDLSLYALDEAVNGSRVSAAAIAAWVLSFDGGWRALASGLAATDPWNDYRFEVMLRIAKDLVWRERRAR